MNPFSLILSGVESAAGTVSSWLADDTMLLSARNKISIGPDIYQKLDPRMVVAPENLNVAFEQAVYFVALAARRALRESNVPAYETLMTGLEDIVTRAEAEYGNTSWMCTISGWGCASGGAAEVLGQALQIVELSGLNVDDEVQISAILAGNKRAVQIKQAVPVIAAVAVGAVIGTIIYQVRNKRASGK